MRQYLAAGLPHRHLRHVSYFLAPVTRKAYWAGTIDLVPSHFSEMPQLLRTATKCSLVIAAASPPDAHGYFSLGTERRYVAPLIGKVPFFLEANARMPRTGGLNQIHECPAARMERSRPPAGGGSRRSFRDERDRAIAASICRAHR
jgi:acyl-CoA hydrolase